MKTIRLGYDASVVGKQNTGIGNYIQRLMQNLAESGTNIEVHAFSNGNKSRYAWYNVSLKKEIEDNKIDIFIPSMGIMPLYKSSKVTYLLPVYDNTHHFCPETMSFKGRLIRRFFQPFSIRTADQVFSISQAVSHEIESLSKVKKVAFFQPLLSDLFLNAKNENQRGQFFLSVATLEPRKNMKLLLDGYESYLKTATTPKPLLLAGKLGWLKDEQTFQQMESLKERKLLEVLGFISNERLVELYQTASCFITLSKYEGFNMPIMEAQSQGCPVICSDIPVHHEASEEKAIFAKLNVESVSQAIKSFTDVTVNTSQEVLRKHYLQRNQNIVSSFATFVRNLYND
ncbi:glycosyltransferase family 4 protein [Bdellovibrio sp. SKB1291214]|uniref:glycosyltransferase family 4 protein n=1 Tax=Bdellovibrio sp. SKB1291214 TaxID=1732569 RepID=UPI000B5171B6|nr:glycosyltransferase family 1 protein [Bdellovibrio sp. SKB1291214]UYL08289.1 glycosyltransferase family 4 protein [Bdellovibrio sp. SKB1291214]